MNELRINYNPFDNKYISGNSSHAIQLYNKGKQKSFDDYIRGIIIDDVLYLRMYYPFENLSELNLNQLNKASYKLLKENESDILKRILEIEGITIKRIEYNVTNDLLQRIGLNNV